MSLSIRSLRDEDFEQVMLVQAASFSDVEPESETSLRAKWNLSSQTCFAAQRGDELFGYLISLPWTFSDPPNLDAVVSELPNVVDCVYLHDLAVAPEARGLGVAKQLLSHLLRVFAASPHQRIALIAVQNSELFWAKFGFERADKTSFSPEKLKSYGEDAVYMVYQKAPHPTSEEKS